MEILNNPRGTGKTTIIVNKAIKTGYPILIGTKNQKHFLEGITEKYIKVYTVEEFIHLKEKPKHILIDELPRVLYELLETDVELATMTSKSLEMYDILNK